MQDYVYSCTNQRYLSAPLHLENIQILEKGTLLYQERNHHSKSGDANIFTRDPNYLTGQDFVIYHLKENLPYLVGLPSDKPLSGICWDYRSDEDYCYTSDLMVEISHPMAWWQEPYFYLCHFDFLEGPL